MTKDLIPGPESSDLSHFYNFQGSLLFINYQLDETGTSHSYLLKSGGTAESTVSVKKLFSYSSFMGDFFSATSKYAFFSASDGVHGEELWRTDGTEEGTVLLKDIAAGSNSSYISFFTVLDDKLFFRAENSEYGREPWTSNGTSNGTFLLKDIVPGGNSSSPSNFTKAAGKNFFTAASPLNSSYSNLYSTDGTSEGTLHLGDQNIAQLISFKNQLYFSNWKDNKIKSTSGTFGDIKIVAETSGNDPEFLLATDTVLFFKIYNNVVGHELWRTNGTQEGTYLVADINPGSNSSRPIHAFTFKGEVYFLADDGTRGTEIWKIVQPSKVLSGKVYIDLNKDGILQSTEPGLHNQKLLIEPGSIEVHTDSWGKFYWAAEPGTYTVSILPLQDWKVSSSQENYTLVVPDAPSVTFGLIPAINSQIISATLTSSAPSRCGFEVIYWLEYANKGTLTASSQLQLKFNNNLSLLESSVTPAINQNGNLSWNFENLYPTQQKKIKLIFRMPGVDAMGDTLNFYTQSSITGTDIIANDTLQQIITCAYDPNDKQVSPAGIEEEHLTLKNSWLDYTIRFQNTGTDTAFTVVLRDTLDLNLDLKTFELLSSSHNMQLSRKDRALTFQFDDIKLPDSTRNEPDSHGFVRYRIKANAGVAEKTVVENKAYIFFDFNPAIETNTTLNTLVTTLPAKVVAGLPANKQVLKVYPNPSSGSINILALSPIKEIVVYNSMGQLLYRQGFKRGETEQTFSLDSLPSGIYLFMVKTNQQEHRQQIVKQ